MIGGQYLFTAAIEQKHSFLPCGSQTRQQRPESARHQTADTADVIVCDGFTGNVILKMAESLHEIMVRQNIHNEYFDRFNFEDYGGTPVLGVNKPVIIGHGISRAKAYKNMLILAQKMIETQLLEKMAAAFKAP